MLGLFVDQRTKIGSRICRITEDEAVCGGGQPSQ